MNDGELLSMVCTLAFLTYHDAFKQQVVENMPRILRILSDMWCPETYSEILCAVSNLPTSFEDRQILESDLYHQLINTEFCRPSDRDRLTDCLLNLLTPFMEEYYVLSYYECPRAIV